MTKTKSINFFARSILVLFCAGMLGYSAQAQAGFLTSEGDPVRIQINIFDGKQQIDAFTVSTIFGVPGSFERTVDTSYLASASKTSGKPAVFDRGVLKTGVTGVVTPLMESDHDITLKLSIKSRVLLGIKTLTVADGLSVELPRVAIHVFQGTVVSRGSKPVEISLAGASNGDHVGPYKMILMATAE